jgi:hypothetical protein
VLDPAGGTDIFQMPAGRVNLTAGTDAVRCLRLSDKGVLRWYIDCCRTPIGNTAASPRFPVIAVAHSFMVRGAQGIETLVAEMAEGARAQRRWAGSERRADTYDSKLNEP